MRSLALLVVLSTVVAACSGPSANVDSVPEIPTVTTTVAPATTTTTAAPATTTTPAQATNPAGEPGRSAEEGLPDARYEHFVRTDTITLGQGLDQREVEIDIHAPTETGPWPVVVTVHGGGWFGGNRSSIGPLADGLADRKVVVFNVGYSTISRGGTFPGMVDDIACAVQHARAAAGEFSSSPQQVTIVGHSAGAHLASLVAYAPNEFGRACPEGPMQGPDAFVGLAGPYDISNLDFLLTPMFGGSIEQVPELWASGNPFTWIADSPDISTLLLHGEDDQIAPIAFSEDLEAALVQAGRDAQFDVLFDRGHADAIAPSVVADRIVRFVAGLGG